MNDIDTTTIQQNTPEWEIARCGSFGASDMVALNAKGEGKTRAALIRRKVAERLCGVPQGFKGNYATEEGHRQEPAALEAYARAKGVFIQTVGLRYHPAFPKGTTHASPDALVGDVGLVQAKSHVDTATHLEAIETKMSNGHILQVQWEMACWGRQWCDVIHYCQQAPENLRLFIFPRVMRDEAVIASLYAAVEAAEIEVKAQVEKYRAMRFAA